MILLVNHRSLIVQDGKMISCSEDAVSWLEYEVLDMTVITHFLYSLSLFVSGLKEPFITRVPLFDVIVLHCRIACLSPFLSSSSLTLSLIPYQRETFSFLLCLLLFFPNLLFDLFSSEWLTSSLFRSFSCLCFRMQFLCDSRTCISGSGIHRIHLLQWFSRCFWLLAMQMLILFPAFKVRNRLQFSN